MFVLPSARFEHIYIVAVSFICGGYRSTRRKPPTCRKTLTNFITSCFFGYTSPWTGSNSQP